MPPSLHLILALDLAATEAAIADLMQEQPLDVPALDRLSARADALTSRLAEVCDDTE